MTPRPYARLKRPWAATFDTGSPWPSRFLTRLVTQTLRNGMPARRYGPVGAHFVSHGLPERPIALALRFRPRHSCPEIDAILNEVDNQWASLSERSPRLPSRPPRLAALALERSAALTIFVFGDGNNPLIVCKVPRGDGTLVEAEAGALSAAEAAGVGPRHLGRAGRATVQEALPGDPLRVQPVTPRNAVRCRWSDQHQQLAEGLARLAATTARPTAPDELDAALDRVLDAPIAGRTRTLAAAAVADVKRAGVCVLRHGDTSPQNCLFTAAGFSGLVDWELAKQNGVAGFDLFNGAVAYLEQGIGLIRWSEERALDALRRAWDASEYWSRARAVVETVAGAASISQALVPQIEIAFFARRLGQRLAAPNAYPTGVRPAAAMLEHVCAHS